ncbi:MAG: dipeptidase [Halioglobus sp.]
MTTSTMRKLLAIAVLLSPLAQSTEPAATPSPVSASEIHSQALVIDSHSDFLDRSAIDGSGLADDPPGAQTTLGKLEQGGVDAQFFSIFVPPAFADYGFARRGNELIDRLEREVAANHTRIASAYSTADITQLSADGKIAALMGIESGHVIENDLDMLAHFYNRGVRYMTLTWSNSNEWADAYGGETVHGGLTDFGVKVVQKMNELGMMVDISHVSDETFWDVMAVAKLPVIASHSSARALMPSKRNMSDSMIEAVAKNGGVIQINFYSSYVDSQFNQDYKTARTAAHAQFKALDKKYADNPIELDVKSWSLQLALEKQLSPPPASRVVDHIVHVIELVGVDHVGMGTDFDGMGTPPAGLEHIGKISAVTEELLQRGYSEEDITKVLGGNLLRVMAENERQAEPSD